VREVYAASLGPDRREPRRRRPRQLDEPALPCRLRRRILGFEK
jgi:hypothetical protein